MRDVDPDDTYEGSCPHWFSNRNYRLFAALAGERKTGASILSNVILGIECKGEG